MNAEKNNKKLGGLSKRFLLAIDIVGYTGYQLAKEVPAISQSTLTHIRLGRNEPSTKVLIAFLDKFPIINSRWLLTGAGEPKNVIQIDHEIEPQNFIKILHEIPVDDLINYIHNFEAMRGFAKSNAYRMFLELRMQRELVEKLEILEARYTELLKSKEGGNSDKA